MLKTSAISTKNFFESAAKKVVFNDLRKKELLKIADAMTAFYAINRVVNLHFICTQNSRRSQLAQVWSFYAANYFKLNINSFSGGTQVTCFHRNTVKTLQKAGFTFHLESFDHQNPTYQISFSGTLKSILAFSKLHNDPLNSTPFIAIIVCADTEKKSAFINSKNHYFNLGYQDLKTADGLENQEEIYLKTSRQIAGELYFIFNTVKKSFISKNNI